MAIKKEEEQDSKQDAKNELDALDALEKEASEFNKVYSSDLCNIRLLPSYRMLK